jgi:hypothetical protein
MATKNTAAKTAPITGTRTAKPADKRGPKAGQARSNQSAKLSAPAKVKAIDSVKDTTSGTPHVCITAPGKDTILIPRNLFVGTLPKLAKVGASHKALKDAWTAAKESRPAAKLATGVDAHNAPHAAKAIADSKAKGKGADPVAKALEGKMRKGDAKQAPKAKAPAKSATERKVNIANDRTYKVTSKNHGAKPGSKRATQLEIVFSHTSTAKARLAGAESCDFKFAADKGFIKFA